MIHITNGGHAAEGIRAAGVPGEVVPWNDGLHDGPVPAGQSLEALRPVRARFIADAGWAPFEEVLAGFERRDRALAAASEHDEVVLWFEHDLYDQLQLVQILDWCAGHPGAADRLSLICDAEFLGPSTPARLAERFPFRRRVTTAELQAARAVWAAFRSADPCGLVTLLDAPSPLPFVPAAVHRLLQHYPSAARGLSRSEAQALEQVAAGHAVLGDLFRVSQWDLEAAPFLGDASFAAYLARLSSGARPLIVRQDGAALQAPGPDGDAAAFWGTHVRLTPDGDAVLAGRADGVALLGIDRWIGGVHLCTPGAVWRWDEAHRSLRRG